MRWNPFNRKQKNLAEEYTKKGIPLLEERCYVERDGDKVHLTPEWFTVYSACLQQNAQETGRSLIEAREDALIEAILYKGSATTKEIAYMSACIRALAKLNAARLF